MPDHVHTLCRFGRTIEVADLMEEVKGSSSKWLKRQVPQFQWQKGYGVFSVSASHVDQVIAYIRMQEKHHKKMTFQEEYRLFLQRYKIEYDERYVWD